MFKNLLILEYERNVIEAVWFFIAYFIAIMAIVFVVSAIPLIVNLQEYKIEPSEQTYQYQRLTLIR